MRLKNRTVASDVVEGLSDCSTGASAGFAQAPTIQVRGKSACAATKSVELDLCIADAEGDGKEGDSTTKR